MITQRDLELMFKAETGLQKDSNYLAYQHWIEVKILTKLNEEKELNELFFARC